VPDRQSVPSLPGPRHAVVTGAAGFIGSQLVQSLLQTGATVIGVDRRSAAVAPSTDTNLAVLHGHQRYRNIRADLLDSAIDPLFVDADVVFHMAGIPGVRPSWGEQFVEYVNSNILAAQRVMDVATRMRVPRLVVASSSSVYGPTAGGPSMESDHPRPASPYAVTKLAEEQLCLAHAARSDCPTSVVALRYFTVYGPRQRPDMFIHRALHSALTGQLLRLYGDGHQRRDFTYIDDVVTATVAAASAPAASGVVNVGGGANASLIDVINIANSLVGREIRIQSDTVRDGDVLTTRADSRRAQDALGWQPTVDLQDGMRAQLQALAQPTHRAA
jgi:UDP-glucuronate 4-epimerase